MQFDISIIVPVYEQWDLMDDFFDCLSNQKFPLERCELIVVDNGSSCVPNTSNLPHFAKLFTCSTPGSYAARNFGISQVSGRLLIFTDADCRPDEGWLSAHWEAFNANGFNFINAGNVIVKKLDQGCPNDYEYFDIFSGIPQKRYVNKRGYGVTANLAFPRDLLSISGVFDESRFSGGDAEFCRRAQKLGAKLAFVPNAVVYHPARATWEELATKSKRVKGGQIRSGGFLRRCMFFIRTFINPWVSIVRLLRSNFKWRVKRRIFNVICKLSVVEIVEAVRLVLGKLPERR